MAAIVRATAPAVLTKIDMKRALPQDPRRSTKVLGMVHGIRVTYGRSQESIWGQPKRESAGDV
jgi:hypothetical protein